MTSDRIRWVKLYAVLVLALIWLIARLSDNWSSLMPQLLIITAGLLAGCLVSYATNSYEKRDESQVLAIFAIATVLWLIVTAILDAQLLRNTHSITSVDFAAISIVCYLYFAWPRMMRVEVEPAKPLPPATFLCKHSQRPDHVPREDQTNIYD